MWLHGFGQAAATYFGKDLNRLTLPEAALLAGLVQRPSYFDPTRHPDRAIARRNLVLSMMEQDGFITEHDRIAAAEVPLQIVPPSAGQGELFNNKDLTAAHRTLPFGTRVEVTQIGSGRSVMVTITDRATFPGLRVISVSRHAAEALGIYQCRNGTC